MLPIPTFRSKEKKTFFLEKGGFFFQLSMIINRLFRSFAKEVPQLFLKKAQLSVKYSRKREGKNGKRVESDFCEVEEVEGAKVF